MDFREMKKICRCEKSKGKRGKLRLSSKKCKEDEEENVKPRPDKCELSRKGEEKGGNRTNSLCYFKSEELQEICTILNIEEVEEQHSFTGAVVLGKFDIVKRLLKDGYIIDTLDGNNEAALMHAVKQSRQDMVEFLVNRGADIQMTDGEGNNALLLAAQSALWDQDAVCSLWRAVRNSSLFRPDHQNKAGYRLLHFAAKRQWHTLVELLRGVPVTLDPVTAKGVTPLMMAASLGDAKSVNILLRAGADVSIEDQQKCTAVCYGIAWSMQRSPSEPSPALQTLLAALHGEASPLPLDHYLKMRLELVLRPPRCRTEFSKTVTTVLTHVLVFFARFVYSGMDLLLELSVFNKLRQAIDSHMEDSAYVTAVLSLTLQLVRHCHCCCPLALSQQQLADHFFNAHLGKSYLDVLAKYGTSKTAVIKVVFLTIAFVCTSESQKAREWLANSYETLQPYYHKYTRAFPPVVLDTAGDAHLQAEKEKAVALQEMMAELKKNSRIAKQTETNLRKSRPLQKQNRSTLHDIPPCRLPAKPQHIYNSIIQYNFGKLDIVQPKNKITVNKEQFKGTGLKRLNNSMGDKIRKYQPINERKSRIAIKEINQKHEDQTLANCKLNKYSNPRSLGSSEMYIHSTTNSTFDSNIQSNNKNIKESGEGNIGKGTTINTNKRTTETSMSTELSNKISVSNEKNKRFAEGYQLFQMEDELNDVESDEETCAHMSSLINDYTSDGRQHSQISEIDVKSSINQLEEIFIRIINRYESTWKKQYEEGYPGASGDAQELLSLMSVLPQLEEYHLQQLTNRWEKFRSEARRCACDNHTIYDTMVNEMRSFLLEFEAELEWRNIKADQDEKSHGYIDTKEVLENINCACVKFITEQKDQCQNDEGSENVKTVQPKEPNEVGKKAESEREVNEFIDTSDIDCVYISEIENNSDKLNRATMGQETDRGSIVDNSTLSHYTVVKDIQSECKTEVPVINNDENNNFIQEETTQVLETNEHRLVEQSEIQDSVKHVEATCILTDYKSNNDIEVDNSTIMTTELPDLVKLNNDLNMEVCPEGRDVPSIFLPVLKKPPGFKSVGNSLGGCLKEQSQTEGGGRSYCGSKYELASLALLSLPACQTELVAGGRLRLARLDYNRDFKLFNGCNFGDIELGLSSEGVPQAVRRFQKLDTLCNKHLVASVRKLVQELIGLNHGHVLPYTAAYNTLADLLLTAPLCQLDLGQYVRQLRADPANYTHASLLSLVKQMVKGIHYLHTLPNPVIHGNLKPSNILVDGSGNLRLAEFGLHQVIFQQQMPSLASMIWWAGETLNNYQTTWMVVCTQQTDIQSTGMLAHFILSLGQHPFGHSLPDIVQNICSGLMMLSPQDTLAMDLISWMLSHEPIARPTSTDVLRHVLFWSTERRWEFLVRCCGRGAPPDCPVARVHADFDRLGRLRDVNTKWVSVLKHTCECSFGSAEFNDTPSGLLKFLDTNLDSWSEVQVVFLELFPVLPLNFMRLLEQTPWINHPHFQPFTTLSD